MAEDNKPGGISIGSVNVDAPGGQAIGVNTGDATFTQNNGAVLPSVDVVFDDMTTGLLSVVPEEDKPKVKASLDGVRTLAKLPPEEQKKPEHEHTVKACLAAITPYREHIIRGVLGGATQGLRLLAPTNAICGILLAGLDVVQNMFSSQPAKPSSPPPTAASPAPSQSRVVAPPKG